MQSNGIYKTNKFGKLLNPEAMLIQELFHSDLLPLENVFDKMLRASFPDIYKEMGLDITSGAYPKANIYETNESLEMVFELAGLNKSDIKIALTDYDHAAKVLTLSGKKSSANEESNVNKSWYLRELKHSSFERKFIIKDINKYDFELLSASFNDGILTITIPKYTTSSGERNNTKIIEIE